MSRIAKAPIPVLSGVEVYITDNNFVAKGKYGTLSHQVHPAVTVRIETNNVYVSPKEAHANASAQAGTARALINNMIYGVSTLFEKRLQLVGVGYRAQLTNRTLNLGLGFSHPVIFNVPEIVEVECPSQTEIVLRSADKAQLGQIAANIRSFRPPEPYKGKGIRYQDEQVRMKEAKKK